MKNVLKKRISRAFGKDVFLLGSDSEGVKYWLEAPSWDCGWYWGFGYVETYTNNNNPAVAKDINSHTHIDGYMGQQREYNHEKHCFINTEFVHNLYECPTFEKTTFTESEGWNLSELFKQFYLLKNMSDFSHKERPGCHITTSPVDHKNLKEWYDKINKTMIPAITKEIMRILTPQTDENEFIIKNGFDTHEITAKSITQARKIAVDICNHSENIEIIKKEV